MEVVNQENEDEEMMDNATASSSTMPMRASAHLLVAKLKKITDSTPNPVPMMIDTKIKRDGHRRSKEKSLSHHPNYKNTHEKKTHKFDPLKERK